MGLRIFWSAAATGLPSWSWPGWSRENGRRVPGIWQRPPAGKAVLAIPVFRMKPGRSNVERAGAADAVTNAAEILRVLPGSPAEKVKLRPGERILEINQVRPADLIDYLRAEAADRLHLLMAGP